MKIIVLDLANDEEFVIDGTDWFHYRMTGFVKAKDWYRKQASIWEEKARDVERRTIELNL